MGVKVPFLLCFVLCTYVTLGMANVYFEERFEDDTWKTNWISSQHKDKEFGKFVKTAGKFYNDPEADQGIQTSQDARFYAISRKFDPFSTDDKTLVVQFSVKFEQDIDCGGGYLKLFNCALEQEKMHGETPYLMMIGPDICGPGTKKVHFIINYNDKNNMIKKEIRAKDDVYTHLYTFIIRPDNTYEVQIGGEKVESGDLEGDWEMLPPKKIKDPEAKKPSDWDDRATIPDPDDTKPDDWEQPEHIPDPDATQPEDWDNDMDGEWEAPKIDNPDYKGEWHPKQIDNPAYKGAWVHPEIDNPEYKSDPTLYRHTEVCAVGIDIWQVKSGTIFDNILITDDVEYAQKVVAEVKQRQEGEKKMKEQQDEEERKKMDEEVKKDQPKEDDEEENEDEEPEEEGRQPPPVIEDAEHDEL